MKRMVGIIGLLFIINSCFAADKILQGDFQVFKLGEGRKKVIQKIKDYVKEGKIEIQSGEGNQITLKKDNLHLFFKYQKNKLYMINILYEEGYKGMTDPKEIVKSIKGLLTESYGPPAEDKGYPEKTELFQVYRCSSWVLATKNIDIVIHTDFRNTPEVLLEIYNPTIRVTVDKELVKDFG